MAYTSHPDTPRADAVVIGGGLAGLSAAYALAREGLAPLVVEERGTPGGLVAGVSLDGVAFDIGAESYISTASRVSDLLATLGLEVCEPSGTSWVYAHDTGATEIPHGMLGIPASLDDPLVAAALSPDELRRARADLTLGPEVGADADDLASFVRARYGEGLLTKLVAPIAGGIHSADVSRLAVDTVCRGLRETLAREGSATAAVAALRGTSPAAPAILAPRGGMFRLPQRLAEEIEGAGGRIATHVRSLGISHAANGGWSVTLTQTVSNPDPALPPTATGLPVAIHTPRVVLALPLAAGLETLSMISGVDVRGWRPTPGGPIAHVTLVVSHPDLDRAPRGSGMLVRRPTDADIAAGCVRAKALTHYSHKWGWMREDHPDVHVLRVSYGRAGEPAFDVTPELGRADASRLLGIDLPESAIRHAFVVRWDGALPPLGPDHWERVRALRADVEANCHGLALAGSWVAGSGIGAVIPQGLDAGSGLVTAGPPTLGAPQCFTGEADA